MLHIRQQAGSGMIGTSGQSCPEDSHPMPGNALPSFMNAPHLRHALYAGEILAKRATSILATPTIKVAPRTEHGERLPFDIQNRNWDGVGNAIVYIIFHVCSLL